MEENSAAPHKMNDTISVLEIITALDATSYDGQVNELAFRKKLGLPTSREYDHIGTEHATTILTSFGLRNNTARAAMTEAQRDETGEYALGHGGYRFTITAHDDQDWSILITT